MATNPTQNRSQGTQKSPYSGQNFNQPQSEPSADGMSNQQMGQGMGDQSQQSNPPSSQPSGYHNTPEIMNRRDFNQSEVGNNQMRQKVQEEAPAGGQQFDLSKGGSRGLETQGNVPKGEQSSSSMNKQTGMKDVFEKGQMGSTQSNMDQHGQSVQGKENQTNRH